MVGSVRDFFENEWYYYRKRITKKYYIIHRSAGGAGFFSNYMWVLGHVIFARKLGYVPVVDMENYPTLYSEEGGVFGEKNAWNYYFENVGCTGLKQAYDSGCFVMGQDMPLHRYEGRFCTGNYRFPTRRAVAYYAPIIEKYLTIKKELKDSFERDWAEVAGGKDRVLGVHVRGTDMKNNLGHPMPAALSVYLEKTRRILEENPHITKIFLATDENNAREAFEAAFRATRWKLFVNDAFRIWDAGEGKRVGIHETRVEGARAFHKYLLGEEVLKDAYFLSKCDHLLCGHSNITNVAILWNNNKFRKVVCLGDKDEICIERE